MGLFKKLPLILSDGPDFHLYVLRQDSWPLAKRLSQREKCFVSTHLTYDEGNRDLFSQRHFFNDLCASLRDCEAGAFAKRCYWILRRREQKIAGIFSVYTPENDRAQNWLTLGYAILPAYRRQGLATRAVRTFCREADKIHYITGYCAETDPENTPSQQVLLHAGFQACGRGLCSTMQDFAGLPMMRYTRTPTKTTAWPFDP